MIYIRNLALSFQLIQSIRIHDTHNVFDHSHWFDFHQNIESVFLHLMLFFGVLNNFKKILFNQ